MLIGDVKATLRGGVQRMAGRANPYFARKRKEIEGTQWLSEAEIGSLQDEEIRRVARHAYEDVAYYAELFDGLKLRPEDIRTRGDLAKLPILSKATLRARTREFVSRRGRLWQYTAHTSGSTGTALTVFRDLRCAAFEAAFTDRIWAWKGVSFTDRFAEFRGRRIVSPERRVPPFWVRDVAGHRLHMSVYHIGESSAREYANAMREFGPAGIVGLASSVTALARLAGEGLKGAFGKALFTGESIDVRTREWLESAVGCDVYDFYGSAERAAYIDMCEKKRYHVIPEYGYVEFVPLGGGSGLSKIVATGFGNTAMPLLRYDTGDLAVVSHDKCACGRAFAVVESISGRNDDSVVTRDGRVLGRISSIFWDRHSVAEAQVVQEEIGKFRINVVTSRRDEAELEAIGNDLRMLVGDDVEVIFERVEAIPRTAGGKFRAVVCKVRREL